MPIKGNWRKDFEAMLKGAADSKAAALRAASEQIMNLARTDGIIEGGSKVVERRNGKGKFMLYLETPQANRWSKPRKRRGRKGNEIKPRPARRIFNETKYFSRKGNLRDALTPTGWSGNHLSTRGEGSIDVHVSEKENYAQFKFTGKAADALAGGDSKKGRNKVEITTPQGVVVQNERGRRRIFPNAAQKAIRVFNRAMQENLDKKLGGIK